MKDVVIVAACRTAIGKFGGTLAGTAAAALGGAVIVRLLERAGIAAAEVDDIIMGQVLTAGVGQNPGAAGGDEGRNPRRFSGHHHQPGLRQRPAGGRIWRRKASPPETPTLLSPEGRKI